MIFLKIFSRKWLLTTALVLLGAAFCARLGLWQLDRLATRRAYNAHLLEMRSLPPLELPRAAAQDLTGMEFRRVTVTGTYDFEHQVALRNYYFENQPGYHLLTPLIMADGTALLVERGWIPADGNAAPAAWRKYDEAGTITVNGILRPGRARADIGRVADPTLTPDQSRLDFWNMPNIARLQLQTPYTLLPVFVQPNYDVSDSTPPITFQPDIQDPADEGPHFGYALQWFTFATILLIGYPFYLQQQEKQIPPVI
jgi:surfeit locus 1 family protein